MDQDIFAPQSGVWLGEKEREERSTLLPFLTAGAGVLLAITIFLLGVNHGAAPIRALTTRNGELTGQVVTLQREVGLLRERWGHCTSDAGGVSTIEQLMTQGRSGAAASVADLALTNTQARPCNPLALAQLWYNASVDALVSSPPTGPDDAASVLRWDSINAQATAFGLPPEARTSPLTIIAASYNGQNWALCRAVFTKSWGTVIGPADRLEAVTYYAATRNEGRQLASTFTGAQRRTGLRLLATAAAIGDVVHRGEAAADLRHMVGPGWARQVQPDQHDPVLQSLRSDR